MFYHPYVGASFFTRSTLIQTEDLIDSNNHINKI